MSRPYRRRGQEDQHEDGSDGEEQFFEVEVDALCLDEFPVDVDRLDEGFYDDLKPPQRMATLPRRRIR